MGKKRSKSNGIIDIGTMTDISHYIDDKNIVAQDYHNFICYRFPHYKSLFEKALQSIPVEDLPMYIDVPEFCLSIIESRLRKGK